MFINQYHQSVSSNNLINQSHWGEGTPKYNLFKAYLILAIIQFDKHGGQEARNTPDNPIIDLLVTTY